jgi:hypothetical protein
MEIDKSKLTYEGSMNYLLQVFNPDDENDESGEVSVDIYHPRKNSIWNGEISKEEATERIKETIERMKIAIQLFEEYLEGKRNHVYYWEFDDEKFNRS